MARRAFINPAAVRRIGAFSHGVATAGGVTLHISGQVAVGADGKVIAPGDMKKQTEAVFENLRLILQEAGGSFDDVVKLTHYVVDLRPEHRPAITEIRSRYVNQANPPASTMIGVPALVMDGLVIEVEAVAVIDESRARHLS